VFELSRAEWSETEEPNEWDDFVVQNGGSLFHMWSWRKVLEKLNSNSRPLYLACHNTRGKLIGICPFFYRKAGRRLSYLESLPSSHMGGPIIRAQEENTQLILESLRSGVRFSPLNPVISLQIRVHQQPIIQAMAALGYPHAIDALFILDLHDKPPEYIWNKGFQKHDRQAVKYYEQLDSWFGLAHQESEYSEFWNLYEESIQRKGAPTRSLEFLSAMRKNLGDQFQVSLTSLDGRIIAAQSLFCDSRNSIVHFAMGGYSRSKNIHSPAIYLNWKIIDWASENKFRYVNFGPVSPNPKDPIYKFKDKFCGEFIPRYRFTLPTSRTFYSFAQWVDHTFRGARSPIS
jgi:CelD/BcsL family acetyltransferase involved in cellulose biosynthesis